MAATAEPVYTSLDIFDPKVDSPVGLLRTIYKEREEDGFDQDNVIERFGKFITVWEDVDTSPPPFVSKGDYATKPIIFSMNEKKNTKTVKSMYEFPDLAFSLFSPLIGKGGRTSPVTKKESIYEFISFIRTGFVNYKSRVLRRINKTFKEHTRTHSDERKTLPDELRRFTELNNDLEHSYILVPMIVGLARRNQSIKKTMLDEFAIGINPMISFIDVYHETRGLIFTIFDGLPYIYDRPGNLKRIEDSREWNVSRSLELQKALSSSDAKETELVRRPRHTTGDIFGRGRTRQTRKKTHRGKRRHTRHHRLRSRG